jgi:hypothetical protein
VRHLLTKKADYLWARPALVANKVRSMELQARHAGQEEQQARSSLRVERQRTTRARDRGGTAGRAYLRTLRQPAANPPTSDRAHRRRKGGARTAAARRILDLDSSPRGRPCVTKIPDRAQRGLPISSVDFRCAWC